MNGQLHSDHSFSTYAKFFNKLTFSTPLIRTRTCLYQGIKKSWFSGNFAYVLNELSSSIMFSRYVEI